MATNQHSPLDPRCVANVRTIEKRGEDQGQAIFFTQAKFSRDGTTIIAQSSDHSHHSHALPPDLENKSKQPHEIVQQAVYHSPSSIQTYELYPRFDIDDYSTTVYLSSSKDLPISLNNAFYNGMTHASYPWQSPTTEEFIAPKSLCWTLDGSCFVAGGSGQLAIFDAHRYGDCPTSIRHTMEKISNTGHKKGYRGVLMGLSISYDGILAAGTTERQIGLYANEGDGDMITAFSIAGPEQVGWGSMKGSGIMQIAWSPCGTYLLAAERQSDGIHVYDIRNTLQQVAFLNGRQARTSQRLGIDVVRTAEGCEVWAGGTDGTVRMWKNPGSSAGGCPPDAELKLHNDSVGSAVWRSQGDILATCSGSRDDWFHASEDDSSDDEEASKSPPDNSLKVWTV